jgi:hypothetical protein
MVEKRWAVQTLPKNSPEIGLLAYLANLTFIFLF